MASSSSSSSASAVIVPEIKRWQAGESMWWRQSPRRPALHIDFTPELSIGEIVRIQRERALAFVETTGQTRAYRLLDEARTAIIDQLAATKAGSFTAATLQANRVQIEAIIRELAQKNLESFRACSDVYSEMAIADAVAQVRLGEKIYSGVSRTIPLKQAAQFVHKQMDKRSILRGYQRRVAIYGTDIVDRIERKLGVMALSGQPVDRAISELAKSSETFKDARWKAARLWRTEMAGAYESSKMATAQHLRGEYFDGDLKKTLQAVLDARTGADSRYVNGQSRELEEPFEDNRGRRYQHPPNRPNDRETVVFVRDEWDEAEGGGSGGGGSGGGGDEGGPKPWTKLPDEELSDATLLAIEAKEAQYNKIKSYERASVFDSEGKEVMHKKGGRSSVSWSAREARQCKGMIVIHNHPSHLRKSASYVRNSFSRADVRFACENELKEIRAIAGDRLYRMRTPAGGGWSSSYYGRVVEPFHKKHFAAVKRETLRDVRKGKLSVKEATEHIQHETWKRVANDTGIRYDLIERKENK